MEKEVTANFYVKNPYYIALMLMQINWWWYKRNQTKRRQTKDGHHFKKKHQHCDYRKILFVFDFPTPRKRMIKKMNKLWKKIHAKYLYNQYKTMRKKIKFGTIKWLGAKKFHTAIKGNNINQTKILPSL